MVAYLLSFNTAFGILGGITSERSGVKQTITLEEDVRENLSRMELGVGIKFFR